MYKLKVKCSCGASLEIEFDKDISITASSAYDKFLKSHEICKAYNHDNSGPSAGELQRLDEINPYI